MSEETSDRRFDLRITARPENLQVVRRALESLDLPPAVAEDAKLLTTELVTNSIRHAKLGRDEEIVVRAHWSGSRLRVVVRDRRSRSAPSVVAGSIRPPPGSRSGWGLFLIDQLTARWGTNLDGEPGYWFDLEAPTAER